MGAQLKFSVIVIVIICTIIDISNGKSKMDHPPHCTVVTKDTDYQSKYRFDYKPAYLIPGQREAFQPLFCLNPPTVNKAVTVVCDWVAPPMVQFTIGDEHVHVMRVDPSGLPRQRRHYHVSAVQPQSSFSERIRTRYFRTVNSVDSVLN